MVENTWGDVEERGRWMREMRLRVWGTEGLLREKARGELDGRDVLARGRGTVDG